MRPEMIEKMTAKVKNNRYEERERERERRNNKNVEGIFIAHKAYWNI